MSGKFRTGGGGRIDRARPLQFHFDGQSLRGLAGDTLASALLANGVHLVGRSFKYHRPRGIMAAGADEPNALVTLARDGTRDGRAMGRAIRGGARRTCARHSSSFTKISLPRARIARPPCASTGAR